METLCSDLKIEKRHSSPYHQGNSTSERTIGTIKSRVSLMLNSRKMAMSDWDLVLQEAVLYINYQVNSTLKYSPFMLTYGSNARTPVEQWRIFTAFNQQNLSVNVASKNYLGMLC